MFVLFFFIPYFHPLFSCFSSGLIFFSMVYRCDRTCKLAFVIF
ncbi:hypothetical protein [Wolbachia pipientis]|nr:hypothetical protein [Wolbachia pipientis]